jgi:3-oxoacyl-[acyl-carrier protein] reductase
MELSLRNKNALVCGGSRGLGKAAALALAGEGARVAIVARGAEALEAAATEIRAAAGVSVLPITADLARPEDIDRVVRDASWTFGGLDILVTNAGGPRSALFDALTDEDWRRAIDLTLMSVVRLCARAVPEMRRRGGGRIINITSVSAKQPVDGLMLSNALRPAVVGFAKTLANELARERILVNCVSPGYTRTDRVVELVGATASREGVESSLVEQRLTASIPMGRMGEPRELADLIAFLASDRASYITGATIQVDGGYVRGIM